jgi:hypothetical protein
VSTFEPGLVRRGIDWLLAQHPHLDVVKVDWQVDPSDGRSVARWRGPWVLVDLGQPSEQIVLEPAWAVWKYAIWRTTGDVYVVGADGAVGDDPILRMSR